MNRTLRAEWKFAYGRQRAVFPAPYVSRDLSVTLALRKVFAAPPFIRRGVMDSGRPASMAVPQLRHPATGETARCGTF